MTAADIIRLLDLRPHPEGGHFGETFRDESRSGGRAASTAIYFLLARGERSHWHRTDAAEVWNWYAGAPLRLDIAPETEARERVTLGSDLAAGERPQWVVPAHAWYLPVRPILRQLAHRRASGVRRLNAWYERLSSSHCWRS